jgi:virginiamycin A acetyltransferase
LALKASFGGVIIGNGAVVGANSFVNTDVPTFAIVIGSLARIIGYRFSEAIIAAINKSKWWNLDLDSAKLLVLELEKSISK